MDLGLHQGCGEVCGPQEHRGNADNNKLEEAPLRAELPLRCWAVTVSRPHRMPHRAQGSNESPVPVRVNPCYQQLQHRQETLAHVTGVPFISTMVGLILLRIS